MSNSVKENILANVESVLKGISLIQNVYRGKSRSINLEESELPAAVLYEQSDSVDERETGLLLSRRMRVVVEFWSGALTSPAYDLDSSLVYLEGLITQAVMEDNAQGGYARYTEIGDTQRILLEDDDTLGGGMLAFDIVYQVNEENPFSGG